MWAFDRVVIFLNAMQRYKNLSVPISLIKYSLERNLAKELRVLLYLKLNTPGKIRLNEIALMKELGIRDKRTLRKLINSLRKNDLLGIDVKAGVIFIRSYQRISTIHNVKGKAAARLYAEGLTTIQDFKNWMTGALVGSTTRNLNRKNKQVSKHTGIETKPSIVLPSVKGKINLGLAVRYFAAKYSLSYSTSQRMLKQAEKGKVISRKKVEVPMDIVLNGNLYLPLACHLPMLFDQFPSMAGRVRVRQSIPFIRMADQVFSSTELTKRR